MHLTSTKVIKQFIGDITKRQLATLLMAVVLITPTATGQTTAFTYQGKLTESGNPANGTYDFQFKLFDVLSGGTPLGGVILGRANVAVSGGIFNVTLDFGANLFTGETRYLEISVRPAGNPNPHTILAPRQPITSSPYAIQTLNAQQLGGLPASRYIATDTNGNVGIGTTAPVTKLDVRGSLTMEPGDSPILYTSTAVTEQNRFLQLVNSPSWSSASGLKAGGILVADSFGYANPGKNDLIVKGNVGIGTTIPLQMLHVSSPTTNAAALIQTPTNAFAQLQLQSGAAGTWIIGSQDNFANGSLLFRNGATDIMAIRQSGNIGIGTTSPIAKLTITGGGLNGYSLLTTEPVSIGGFVTQSRDKGGIVKAMAFINADGTIARCYNGVTGASSGTCGFTVDNPSAGFYDINFGFQVSDRFIHFIAPSASGCSDAGISLDSVTGNVARILTFCGTGANRAFLIFVY